MLRRLLLNLWVGLTLAAAGGPSFAGAEPVPSPKAALVEAALLNVLSLNRPGEDGYATVWDGNKYVQCRPDNDGGFRCEAAGSSMQPSLDQVLTPSKTAILGSLGWMLDMHFGNYVRTFPAATRRSLVASEIIRTLVSAYDADPNTLEVETDWVRSEPCPPRNGPSQNLAGMVNDAPSMKTTSVHACGQLISADLGFDPTTALGKSTASAILSIEEIEIAGEIDRLRINLHRSVHVLFDIDIGYIQCQPETAPEAIYCEAASAYSWPALAGVLTPDRVARLHATGYADPGRAQNYSKTYPLTQFSDQAIAQELLQLLRDAYGYNGGWAIKIETEKPAG
jgi:hypothetical protein